MNAGTLPYFHCVRDTSPWNDVTHIKGGSSFADLNLYENAFVDLPEVCFHGNSKYSQVDNEG